MCENSISNWPQFRDSLLEEICRKTEIVPQPNSQSLIDMFSDSQVGSSNFLGFLNPVKVYPEITQAFYQES